MKTTYCISGEMRSGKDTAANYLCDKLECRKYAIAEPLKKMVANLTDTTIDQLDRFKNENWDFRAYKDDNSEAKTMSFRKMLQLCGDELKEFFGLDCFMRKLHLKLLEEDNSYAVISDVRLKEEQDWLTAHTNPIFIKIVRDTETNEDSTHRTESEVGKLGYDVKIENNGTIEELYEKLDMILPSREPEQIIKDYCLKK